MGADLELAARVRGFAARAPAQSLSRAQIAELDRTSRCRCRVNRYALLFDNMVQMTFEMPDSSLWTLYERLRVAGAPLSMRKVCERSEIFPVFHDLFQRRVRQERAP